MRLQSNEIAQIKETILREFGKSDIYIFGSRLDDKVRGGDIDIFIIPNKRSENERTKKAKAIYYLEERLLKPIDIVIHSDFNRLIEQEALKGVLI